MSPQAVFRLATAVAGVLFVALTAGFLLSWDWATALWPFIADETRLDHIFIASITIAIGLPAVWIAASGSLRSAAAGSADLVVMFAAMSLYLFARSGGRPMPRPLRGAFAVICVVLLVVATLLARQTPHVFPWPLAPESSVMYGFIFYGAAVYFLIGAIEGRWASAAGQLIGFLAYDLVLIVPFVRHLATVPPAHRPSLIVYIGVLATSSALALYYLLVKPETRITTRNTSGGLAVR